MGHTGDINITMIELFINAIRAYVYAGLLFSAFFILFGVQRVDPDATGLNIGFRLIIVPGLCIFWPLFAVRWFRGKKTPTEKNAHRLSATQLQ